MLLNKFDKDVHIKLIELRTYLVENPKEKYKFYGFRIQPQVMDYLDYLNKLSGVPVSQMVREGIELYLKQLEQNIILK